MHDQVGALGADLVIEPDGTADHGPYDVVLELVGAPGVEPALGALAIGARVVVIGVGAGAKVELNLLVLMNRRATIGGSTLRARPVEEKADVVQGVGDEVLPKLATGEIRVPVAATYPMSEATAGYERFAAGGKLGKVVLLGT
jgi:NADPH:quinone reductase-like Zn-dependent oxidoreductase